MTARTSIWKSIRASLTQDIASACYQPGDKLPTEAALARRFGVNRHTVRRALSDLAEQGLVHTRRGAGVYVAHRPTDYPLGQRVRFAQNIRAAGRLPGRDILRLETRLSDPREAEMLGLAPGDPVHVFEALSHVDGMPMALGSSVFPAARFPRLIETLTQGPSVTRAFAAHGIADYTRAFTAVTAEQADAVQAGHLRISEGAPILHTTAVNVDPDGQPVEYGHAWFAGDRVTLTLTDETPGSEPS